MSNVIQGLSLSTTSPLRYGISTEYKHPIVDSYDTIQHTSHFYFGSWDNIPHIIRKNLCAFHDISVGQTSSHDH